MAEPRRLDGVHGADANDRDSQAEVLLVDGLDQYFAGRYEDAIHIWTRVLFLDRSHARARAYIDRARTALAERQRRGEEMLQASQDLLGQGRTDAARHLLIEAVATAGEDERASAVRAKLERLERLERVRGGDATRSTPIAPAGVVPGWQWPQPSRGAVAFGATLVVGLVLLATVASPAVQDWFRTRDGSERLAATAPAQNWTVPSSSDVALVRARTLYNRGRLAEALQALDRVSPDSSIRTEANDLRLQIQQMLLAGGQRRSRTGADR